MSIHPGDRFVDGAGVQYRAIARDHLDRELVRHRLRSFSAHRQLCRATGGTVCMYKTRNPSNVLVVSPSDRVLSGSASESVLRAGVHVRWVTVDETGVGISSESPTGAADLLARVTVDSVDATPGRNKITFHFDSRSAEAITMASFGDEWKALVSARLSGREGASDYVFRLHYVFLNVQEGSLTPIASFALLEPVLPNEDGSPLPMLLAIKDHR